MSDQICPLVKICGVRDADAAAVAADSGADMIGMIFADARRKVDVEAARGIRDLLGKRVTIFESTADALAGARIDAGRPLLVGVFARQRAEEIVDLLDLVDLDVVQLSGGEDPAFAARIPRPVIRATHVSADSTAADLLADAAKAPPTVTLLDAYSRQGGGSGEAFDWDKARAVAEARPIVLAGGLTPENAGEAVEVVRPWAVDVSSGVETGGVKDHAKIRAFVAAVKGAVPA